MKSKNKGEAALIARYGGVEQLKQKRQEWQAKSRENYSGDGGFRYLKEHNPDKLKEVSHYAVKIREQKAAKKISSEAQEES